MNRAREIHTGRELGVKELQALPSFFFIIHCVCCEAHRRWIEKRLLGKTLGLSFPSVSGVQSWLH